MPTWTCKCAFAMPLNPPKKKSGKNNDCQLFSKGDLYSWQGRLNHENELKQGVWDILQATTQQKQLTALKLVGANLSSSTRSNEADCVLRVLVEVHSRCASRHPLQRAIASLLQSQPDSLIQTVIKDHIGQTLEAMIREATVKTESEVALDKQLKAVHYVEVLMENFPLGQQALESNLPLVLDFCTSTMDFYKGIQRGNSPAMAVLLALIKTITALLLKTTQQLYIMVTTGGVEGLCWPNGLEAMEEQRKWTEDKLNALCSHSEKILLNSGSIPHDVTVSSAMLLVATLNITLRLLPSFAEDLTQTTYQTLADRIQGYWSSFLPFAKLSLCHALLAKLPLIMMAVLEMEGQPLLVSLFQHITQLSSSFSESSKRYIASRTLALWANVARECASTATVGSTLYHALEPTGAIVQTQLQYIWSQWEDPIDGIRHQCRDMFVNIIKTCKYLQQADGSEDFLLRLTEMLLSSDAPTRGRFVLLSSLCPHVPPERILQVAPHLPHQLMAVMGHQALACHAGDLWSRLVTLHWAAVVGGMEAEMKWSEIWILPLVSTMCADDQLALRHITQHCLPSLFQACDKSLHLILMQCENISKNAAPGRMLTTQLACFRSAKAHLREGLSQLSSLYSLEDLFKRAMSHADEQVRLSALGLLCESQRTTEPPKLHLLPHLLTFVQLNANNQSPGFRYPVLTAFKKLFVRMRDSCYALSKAFQKSNGSSESPNQLVAGYQKFLRALLNQQFEVLHPLSSFQRRSFSLSLLQTLASVFSLHKEETTATIPPIFDFALAVSREHARVLLEGLSDPFDANRTMCLELLYKLNPDNIGLNEPEYFTKCVQSYIRLVSSPKSVNCTSAAFLLKLLTHFCCEQFTSSLSRQLAKNPPSNQEEPLIGTALLLCQLLMDHVNSARTNLIKASITAPMYGVLQSIRTVAEILQLKPTLAVQDVVKTVIGTCVQVSKVVSPVVCSSSPEGFLPDGSPRTGDFGENDALSETAAIDCGSAQSLLLCCWHSMKEISLLLGYLAGELSVGCEDKGILSHNQVELISEVFIHQLTEARHRGAFEMAYTGFCKLCRCLWSSSSPSLSKKPPAWIQELLDSLQTSSLARLLSITRRSAGLPFYVQAILTSEPSYTGYTCLKYTLETLLKVARTGLSSSVAAPLTETGIPLQSEPAAVHALNILRSLYRESKLGDFVLPFIPEGIMIAIEGFSASLWPVRNSSTLLFSALVSRVFGAKRVQDEHSMENKMTGREFFTRFPALHPFLLKQLEQSAAEILSSPRKLLQPSLFPSLLLLSRLYPSPLDEDNSSYSLHLFIPYLLSSTSCPVWKTRVLVSRTLISLTKPPDLSALLHQLNCRLQLRDQNTLHGSLLTLSFLVREREKLMINGSGEECLATWMLKALLDASHIASSDNVCGLTACLYMDVLHSLLEFTLKTAAVFSLPHPQLHSLNALLTAATYCCFNNDNRNTLFSGELIVANFNFLHLVANHYDKFNSVLDDSSILDVKNLVYKALQSDKRELCHCGLNALCSIQRTMINHDETFKVIITRVIELAEVEVNSEILARVYSFLAEDCTISEDAVSKVFPLAYQQCLRPTNTLELRLSLIQFISKAFTSLPINHIQTYLADWIAFLREVSVPTQPHEIRECIAGQLAELWTCASGYSAPLISLSTLVITLLQDPDQDVCIQAAGAVTKLLPGTLTDGVECLHTSRALRLFITHSLTKQVNSELSFKTLLSLLSTLAHNDHTLLSTLTSHSSTPLTPSQHSNLLFDEDPINDYAEDILVMELLVVALMEGGPFSDVQKCQLAKMLPSLVGGEVGREGSPWEDTWGFKMKIRLKVMRPLFETVWQMKTCHSSLSECLTALDNLSIVK